MSNLKLSLNDNIIKQEENNFSIVSENTDIWDGELPFHPGDIFPTEEIKERASVSKTNKMIYNNDVDGIYTNIISILPETDPFYGWQVREIVTNLPYFKNAINAWVGLIAGDTPLIDTDNEMDVPVSELIESSNFGETIQNEVRSRFMDIISAYRVDVNLEGKPVIIPIEAKNLICYVNKEKPNSIEVNVVFSIYQDDSGFEFIDFVEYFYDGRIHKLTYFYNNGKIGDLVKEEETLAFDGIYKVSPIVVFKHNVTGSEIYGTDQFRYWSPSMLAGMRELQNILRLGERTRELIRKVPNSAIKKNPADGSSMFFNKGTIGYEQGADGNSPDVEYVVPEIRMEEAVKALDQSIKQIGMDTQLGIAFFNLESLGSRLSAESIRAAMFPARLEAKRMISEMKPAVRELIVKLGYLANIDISGAKLSIEFYDGFPKDELNDIKSIQVRLESKTPSITLEDAIMKLDRVPLRVARQKADEIRAEQKRHDPEFNKVQEVTEDSPVEETSEVEKVEQAEENEPANSADLDLSKVDTSYDKNNLLTHEVAPSAGKSNLDKLQEYFDNTVWENQMYPKPRDIPMGSKSLINTNNKRGVIDAWTRSRLHRSH